MLVNSFLTHLRLIQLVGVIKIINHKILLLQSNEIKNYYYTVSLHFFIVLMFIHLFFKEKIYSQELIKHQRLEDNGNIYSLTLLKESDKHQLYQYLIVSESDSVLGIKSEVYYDKSKPLLGEWSSKNGKSFTYLYHGSIIEEAYSL